MLKKNVLLSLLSLSICSANAMGIDSLFSFTDETGVGSFKVTNDKDYRQYFNVLISKVDLKNGEMVKTPYSRENLLEWTLTARPAKTIINPKAKKEFKFSYKPLAHTNPNKDQVFQVSFIPTPYLKGDEKPASYMQLAVGFAPYLLVPAKEDQPLKYQLTRNKDSFYIENYGNSYIHAVFNSCDKKKTDAKTDDCLKIVNVMAGRKLNISAPKDMVKSKEVNVELTTHNVAFKDNHKLKLGQKVTQDS